MVITISLAQMDVKLGAQDFNFNTVRKMARSAVRMGSDLVLFPELWSSGYDLENSRKYADVLGQGMFAQVSQLAAELGIAVGGSLLEVLGEDTFNTFTIYNARGELAAVYRKIHLFRLMDEHLWLTPGNQMVFADIQLAPRTQPARLGLGVCYDLRFPEMFRQYALDQVRLLLIPAEWPLARINHWQVLLRARAIENQVFVAAVNRVGSSKGETFGGASAIIDPWGNTLAEADQRSQLLTLSLDLTQVTQIQNRIPVLADRRTDIY